MRKLLKDLMPAVAGGLLACGMFLLLLPGKVPARISHGLLGLPGPGSAVCVVYGPFAFGSALLVSRLLSRKGVVFVAVSTFAAVHSLPASAFFPEIATVGTVGPPALRILSLVWSAAVAELIMHVLRDRARIVTYAASAVGGNLALVSAYWLLLYPLTEKGWVKPAAAATLIIARQRFSPARGNARVSAVQTRDFRRQLRNTDSAGREALRARAARPRGRSRLRGAPGPPPSTRRRRPPTCGTASVRPRSGGARRARS